MYLKIEMNSKKENLITLCRSCHSQLHRSMEVMSY